MWEIEDRHSRAKNIIILANIPDAENALGVQRKKNTMRKLLQNFLLIL